MPKILTPDEHPNPCFKAAIGYVSQPQRQLWLFLSPPGEKKGVKSKANDPSGRNWGMTCDKEQLIRDFNDSRYRDCNICFPTGYSENGFFVVEVDTKAGHGKDGAATLQKLIEANGNVWPDTLQAQSPTGSVHYYFTYPDIPDGSYIPNSDGMLGPGIDVRGDGGMVVAPPSLHAKSKDDNDRYFWRNKTGIRQAPQWLVDKVVSRLPDIQPGEPEAEIDKIRAALELIPNTDEFAERAIREDDKTKGKWEFWNRVGMALFRATGGSDEGFRLFDEWSRQSKLYNAKTTRIKWYAKMAHSVPRDVGAGTLFRYANMIDAGFVRNWESQSRLDAYASVAAMAAEQKAKEVEALRAKVDDVDDETIAKAKYDAERAAAEAKIAAKMAEDRKANRPPSHDINEYCAYGPGSNYIHIPTLLYWKAQTINSIIPPIPVLDSKGKPVKGENGKPLKINASTWLNQNKMMNQKTWAPGEPMFIRGKYMDGGVWNPHENATCFNEYRPPKIELGDPTQALPWIELVMKVFPNDYEHILDFFAYTVQFPAEKINHALFLGGAQGIGKDTIITPLGDAVGWHNFNEASPAMLMEKFNTHLRCKVLRISEVHDLGGEEQRGFDRFKFYEKTKTILVTPPESFPINEKFGQPYRIRNVCSVIVTSNHKEGGIYLEPGDRRYFIAWSDLTRSEFEPGYWSKIWGWMRNGGTSHVAAYLHRRDVSRFEAKEEPRKTEAWNSIVHAYKTEEDNEIADAIEAMGNPDVFTLAMLESACGTSSNLYDWLQDRKNRTALRGKLRDAGYEKLNSGVNEGLWIIKGRRQTIYRNKTVPIGDARRAAKALVTQLERGEPGFRKSNVHPFPGDKI